MIGHVENPLALHAMGQAIGAVMKAVIEGRRPVGPIFISLLGDISEVHHHCDVLTGCLPVFIELKRLGRVRYADSCVSRDGLRIFDEIVSDQQGENNKRLAILFPVLATLVVGHELDRRLAHGIADNAGLVSVDAPALFDAIKADVDYAFKFVGMLYQKNLRGFLSVERLIDLDAVSVTVLDLPDNVKAKLRASVTGSPVSLVAPTHHQPGNA